MTLEECAQKIMKRLTHKPYQRQPLMVFMRNGSVSREEALRVIADELRATVAEEQASGQEAYNKLHRQWRDACEGAQRERDKLVEAQMEINQLKSELSAARGQAESGSGT